MCLKSLHAMSMAKFKKHRTKIWVKWALKMTKNLQEKKKGQNDFNIMFFICHVESFIKILSFRTHDTNKAKKKKLKKGTREVVKCRDEKNTLVDHDRIKFHRLFTTQQPSNSQNNTQNSNANKFSHSFPTEEFSLRKFFLFALPSTNFLFFLTFRHCQFYSSEN